MPKKSVRITLLDGSVKEFPSGVTAMKVAESIGSRLASAAVVAEVNGILIDLSTAITSDVNFKIHTFDSVILFVVYFSL